MDRFVSKKLVFGGCGNPFGGPWGPGEVETAEKLKKIDGLGEPIPMIPYMMVVGSILANHDSQDSNPEIFREIFSRNFPRNIGTLQDMNAVGRTPQKHQYHILWSTRALPVP